jgi:hypothetical protein
MAKTLHGHRINVVRKVIMANFSMSLLESF